MSKLSNEGTWWKTSVTFLLCLCPCIWMNFSCSMLLFNFTVFEHVLVWCPFLRCSSIIVIIRGVFKTLPDIYALRKNFPNMEFFWSVFSRIWTEYGDLRSKYLYSVQIRENTDQKNFVFGHFSRSDDWIFCENI